MPLNYVGRKQTPLWWYVLCLHFFCTVLIGRAQGIIATMVQLFFAWRVKVLTGNIWLVMLLVVGTTISGRVSLIPSLKERVRTNHYRRHSWWHRHFDRNSYCTRLVGVPKVQSPGHCLASHIRRRRLDNYCRTYLESCTRRFSCALAILLTAT